MKHTLINFYRAPSRIFVMGGLVIHSNEGTMQGCSFAMSMYTIMMVPLTKEFHGICKQVWFADDATAGGKLAHLHTWWLALAEKGPKYGYFPKASKSWLIVKESLLEEAQVLFADTEVQITSDDKRHLGAAVGSAVFKNDYISEKVEGWVASIERLAKFAVTQPHAAFSAFTHRLQSRWTFVSRTVPGLVEAFQPIEDAIRTVFIPSLLGREVNALERDLFALPARHSGLGIFNPCVNSSFAFENSVELTAPLVALFSDHEARLFRQI